MAARFAETISILLTNTKSISVTVKKSLWPYFVTQITHIQTLWPHKSPLIMSTLTLVTNIFTTFLLFALRLSYLNLPWLYSLYRLGTERMRTFSSTREHHICTFRNRPIFYFSAWLMIFFFNRFFFASFLFFEHVLFSCFTHSTLFRWTLNRRLHSHSNFEFHILCTFSSLSM